MSGQKKIRLDFAIFSTGPFLVCVFWNVWMSDRQNHRHYATIFICMKWFMISTEVGKFWNHTSQVGFPASCFWSKLLNFDAHCVSSAADGDSVRDFLTNPRTTVSHPTTPISWRRTEKHLLTLRSVFDWNMRSGSHRSDCETTAVDLSDDWWLGRQTYHRIMHGLRWQYWLFAGS